MLARTFLTAKQLGVSEVDRQAAIEVLELLEGGQLKYMDGIQQLCCNFGGLEHVEESPPPFPNSFNMAFRSHCIGGWMEIAKGRMLSLRTQKRWGDLFEPECENFLDQPERFTPERCARALHAKLTTGKADWSSF